MHTGVRHNNQNRSYVATETRPVTARAGGGWGRSACTSSPLHLVLQQCCCRIANDLLRDRHRSRMAAQAGGERGAGAGVFTHEFDTTVSLIVALHSALPNINEKYG